MKRRLSLPSFSRSALRSSLMASVGRAILRSTIFPVGPSLAADPVSDDTRAEHVADELIFVAIPGKERGTGTAAPIEFLNVLYFVGGDFDFILQDSGGPEQADYVSLFGLAEANGEVRRVLAEVAGGSVDFEFLAQSSGEDFNFRADGALVVVESLEREAQRVVLVAAFIAEQHGGAVILRDQQDRRRRRCRSLRQ